MIFLILTLFIFSMDLYLKNQIEQADQSEFPKTLSENRLILTRTHNKGMFMNLLDKHPLLTKVLPGGCLLYTSRRHRASPRSPHQSVCGRAYCPAARQAP